MSKVTRADWAASVPWDGITNKPATPSGGVTDIGQLTGKGFSVGNYAKWNGSKFVPGAAPTVPPIVVPTIFSDHFFAWDAPPLMPLQSAWEDFPVIGASVNQIVSCGPPFNVGLCIVFCYIPFNDTVRIQVTNFDSVAVDLGPGTWRIRWWNTN